jgi:hypothetical protein
VSLSNIKNTSLVDLSKHHTVFCDSIQALEWAYQSGLPESAIIKSSAPSLLWSKNPSIKNIEERWSVDEITKFQGTIKSLVEDIFDLALNIPGIEREAALAISLSVYQFQKIIYKAACLEDEDFTDSRLFIYVEGKTGTAGNIMNSPWEQLLSSNLSFNMVKYFLKNDKWNVLTTDGISFFKRFKVAGYETLIYRIALKMMKKLPDWMFVSEIIVPNENELNIEIVSSLILRGMKVKNIQLGDSTNAKNIASDMDITSLYKSILPIMRKRIKEWVVPNAVDATMSLFKSHLEKQLKQFKVLVSEYERVIVKNSTRKQFVLANAPGNIKGYALAYVCRKNDILLMSSQHGVTIEISKAHDIMQIAFDNSVSDIMFSYNSRIIDIEKSTYFDKSKHYCVGMPLRLIRMRQMKRTSKSTPPIVFISTNLYHMGFSLAQKTDYGNAVYEHDIVVKVLSRLPHKVRYKTYPEDNRRYADIDPVLNDLKKFDNIELFSDKLDMRYLISEHRVLVTTGATSTLGWPVMSGKPVIFINQKENNPLTDDAYISLSKGIFVFDGDDKDFYKKLRNFLSQPINEIERLWKEKKNARKEMIENYFSAYEGGAGKRAAKILLKEYIT